VKYKNKLDKAEFGHVVSKAFPEVKRQLAEDALRHYLVEEAAKIGGDKHTRGSYNMSPFAGTALQPKPPPPELIDAQEVVKSKIAKLERLRQHELKMCKTEIEEYGDKEPKKKRLILLEPETAAQKKATVRVRMLADRKQQLVEQLLTPINDEISCYTGNIIAHIINPRVLGTEEGLPVNVGIIEEDEDRKADEEVDETQH
jgi:hypothetical protein